MTATTIPKVYDKARAVAVADIPIIDFGPFSGDPSQSGSQAERGETAAAIGRACEQVGFFYLVNHGVSQQLIDETYSVAKQFHQLPFVERMRAAATLEHWRGYVPARLRADGATVAGALDTYRFMLDLPPDDPDVRAGKPLHLPNRWPDNVPGFRPVTEAYFAAAMRLSAQLREAFACALGLPTDYFEPYYRKPLVQLSLLHYRPPASLREEDLEIGAGEHQDTGAFTLLLQDDTGGLEVQRKDGSWIAAPHVPGAYVINIGNVMMRWTNGRFVSTPHRVVNRSARSRYSIPFFANPDYDATVAPIEAIMASGEAARFEPLAIGPYMVDFYNQLMGYLHQDRNTSLPY